MGFEARPLGYSLGDATKWARKPHVGSEENLRGYIFSVDETYALWEKNQKIAMIGAGELKFLAITE